MRQSSGADVSARIDGLIKRHHNGDRRRAAVRLGIKPEHLDGLLSGDWRQFSLDALIAVMRAHEVSVDWLLSPIRNWEGDLPSQQTWTATRIDPEELT